MEIKDFVQKAKEGGFDLENYHPMYITEREGQMIPLEGIFIMPEAWKAVGNAEKWPRNANRNLPEVWQEKMRGLTDALIRGETIGTYLKTL